MEEEKYTVYDLEQPVSENTEVRDQSLESLESSEVGGQSSEESDSSEDSTSELNAAESEIQRMVKEIGADKVLEVIKDNRNSAIRQIISEISSSKERILPSGDSTCRTCNSIFDLAALA